MRLLFIALILTAGCMVGEDTTDQGSEGGGGGGDGTGGGGGGGDGMGRGSGDGTGSGSGSGMGSGTMAACTGAAYDPCTEAAQCMSGSCQLFQQAGIQVCTTTCSPGDATTCPTYNVMPAQCYNMGICKPPGANSCTR